MPADGLCDNSLKSCELLELTLDKRLLDILVCPVTKGKLVFRGDELWSTQAALAYPVRDGIPVMLEQEARSLSLDEVESLKAEKR